MSNFTFPPNSTFHLQEIRVNNTNGQITTTSPVSVTPPSGYIVVGFAYDSTIPGWRLLAVQQQS